MRYTALAVVVVATAVVLSGCLVPDAVTPPVPVPVVHCDDVELTLLATSERSGSMGAGCHDAAIEAVCDAVCPDIELRLRLPNATAALERLFVTVSWDGAQTPGFDLSASAAVDERRGHDAYRLTFLPPFEPEYDLGLSGSGAFRLSARLVVADGQDGLLLPNLVTTTPGAFQIPQRGDGLAQGDTRAPVYDNGCYVHDERVQGGAERCLRFGNAPGNAGLGPLEVRLRTLDGVEAVAGEGQFVQRIRTTDGEWDERGVKDAVFHPTHAHFHYVGFSDYRLYVYDMETGLRGPEVGIGNKVGFCPIDFGPMEDSEVQSDGSRYTGVDCLVPRSQDWIMGISAGEYDLYGPGLADQYVEVSTVPDGIYQLVSTVDVDDTLLEASEEDNAASVVLRLSGNAVDVLEAFSFYGTVEDMPE